MVIMSNARRIASLEAKPAHRLSPVWQDGGCAIVDMKGIVDRLPYFVSLKDEAQFQSVSVIDYGTGVEWANAIDYSANSLEEMAAEQANFL